MQGKVRKKITGKEKEKENPLERQAGMKMKPRNLPFYHNFSVSYLNRMKRT